MFLRPKRKNQKKFVPSLLKVNQSENGLAISGNFGIKDLMVLELWIISKSKQEKFEIASTYTLGEFDFQCSIDKILNLLLEKTTERIFNWYIKVKALTPTSKELINKAFSDTEMIEMKDAENSVYYIPCGKFLSTDINGLKFWSSNGHSLLNFVNNRGNLSLIIDGESESKVKVRIDKFRKNKTTFTLEGKLFTNSSLIINGEILLVGRETNLRIHVANIKFKHLKEESNKNYGLNQYWYTITLNFGEICKNTDINDDIFDIYLRLNLNDKFDTIQIRIGKPRRITKLFLRDLYVNNINDTFVINPYYTFKNSNLSMEINRFSNDTFCYLKRMMCWSWFIRLIHRKKNVWLVGERVYKAQDTGLAFFKYMREKHPNHEVYYVIDRTSPERHNVEKYGGILDFKSKDHIKYTIIAKKILSSHHPDYLYPLRTDRFKRKVKADKIFLQHGVLGTKNITANYGVNSTSNFETDFFVVSSDFEKNIVVNDLGYKPNQVLVTGLPRFDALFAKDIDLKRQVLIIPTWRDWIINDQIFTESEYFLRYKNLINNKQMHSLAKKYNFDILFCLHPNMQRFREHFRNTNVKVIKQGEVDVQVLIKESMLMITDYSSVGFDFSFLNKPVIYYQFDRDKFIGKKPSHLDLDNDLPGEICCEEDDVLEVLAEYAKSDFKMKDEYRKRTNKFIKYRDQSSSERIYKLVSTTRSKKAYLSNIKAIKFLRILLKK